MSFKLIIITAPSGAGKTTIVRHLLQEFEDLAFSISATTRKRRSYEVAGKDYYFMQPDEFRRQIEDGGFVEWEEVYENQYYGTLRSEVERLWAEGKHIVFDIDVKGALNLKRNFPDRSLAIFIQPPSLESLRQRLDLRETEDPESLNKRMDRARMELSYANEFDRILVNDNLQVSFKEAESLVRAFLAEDL